MADAVLPPEIAAMSFEEALQELEQIVKRLESGSGKLALGFPPNRKGATSQEKKSPPGVADTIGK